MDTLLATNAHGLFTLMSRVRDTELGRTPPQPRRLGLLALAGC